MALEIFIDHTALHNLRTKEFRPQDIDIRINEVLHMVEHLILAKTIWVSNTVPTSTMEKSNEIIKTFTKFDLTDAWNSGDVRIASFSEENLKNASKNASYSIIDSLENFSKEKIEATFLKSINYQMMPNEPISLNYPQLCKIGFDSDEANRYIEKSLQTYGWESTSSVVFLNSRIYRWFQKNISVLTPYDIINQHLHTISRWKINEELARELSSEDRSIVYVPAFGRSISLDSHLQNEWTTKINLFNEQNSKLLYKWSDEQGFRNFLRDFGALEKLPMVGIWVINQLKKENPTLDDLIELIANLRKTKEIGIIQNWYSNSHTEEFTEVYQMINTNLGIKNFVSKTGITTDNLKNVMKLFFGDKVKDIAEKKIEDYPFGEPLKKFILNKFLNKNTVLTSLLADTLKMQKTKSYLNVSTKIKSILS